MVRLALLGPNFQSQLDANPDALQGVHVVWTGEDLTRFVQDDLGGRPQVLVIDFSTLREEDPAADLDRVRRAAEPELILVVYSYARREVLESLQDERTRTLQGPVPLGTLRAQMLGLIVRDMLGEKAGETAGTDRANAPGDAGSKLLPCPTCGEMVPRERLSAP